MSERGSFVTEYFYCSKCFEAVKEVLKGDEKYLKTVQIPMWKGCSQDEHLPILAGKIGGLYSGEELHTFEFEFIPKIAEKICHPIRIAVLVDNGEKIFKIKPNRKE